MNVVVGMPWRPGVGRLLAHTLTIDYYKRVLPEAKIIEVDTPHVEYNLAAARNAAVRHAEEAGADVVVIADADCIFESSHHVQKAIDAAFQDGMIHMPFSDQRYLTEEETVALAVFGTLPPLQGSKGNGCCYICRPDAYWRAGGSDERFSGWGGDDDQLVAAAKTLTGLRRHGAVSLSLWHPAVRDVGSDRHRPNSVLARRYWQAIGNECAMRAIIAERSY